MKNLFNSSPIKLTICLSLLFTMGFFRNKMSVLGNFAHHITLKPGETGGGLLGVLGQSLGYLLIKK